MRALVTLIALLCLATTGVQAAERLTVSGFGTLGYATDNHPNIAAYRDISQLPDNGHTTGPSWKIDTRLGLQFDYQATPHIGLVGQLVLRDHFRANTDSTLNLAYVSVHHDPALDFRIGRINYDAFLMSDHRNVGYAYPWVRPPLEFYGWIPIFSVDGIDAAYTLHENDVLWRIKAQAGKSEFWIPVNGGAGGGYKFRADNLFSLSLTRQWTSWRLKAAHSRFTSSREIPLFAALHNGLDQVAAANLGNISTEAADLRRNLAFKDAKISYTTLGAVYDDNTWLAQAELGISSSTAEVIPTSRMAYVNFGRHVGQWLPFITLSTSRPSKEARTAANDWGAQNSTVRDPALSTMNALRINQDTLSLGVRWDFQPQAALKIQLDHTRSRPPGYGVWMREQSLARQPVTLKQLSVTLDFVF